MSSVIAVIVVLGGLIFFYELGHFLVARGLGMGVSVFSLGFGKRLLLFCLNPSLSRSLELPGSAVRL